MAERVQLGLDPLRVLLHIHISFVVYTIVLLVALVYTVPTQWLIYVCAYSPCQKLHLQATFII